MTATVWSSQVRLNFGKGIHMNQFFMQGFADKITKEAFTIPELIIATGIVGAAAGAVVGSKQDLPENRSRISHVARRTAAGAGIGAGLGSAFFEIRYPGSVREYIKDMYHIYRGR